MERQKKFDKIFGLEFLLIVLFSIPPLFFNLAYKINIFLSWDGAYRLSEGQVPFRDFGLPMGFAYWVIPSVFFTIFGASFTSLIKAQVFINIISGLTFRSILKTFDVPQFKRVIGLLIYCLTFIFGNFWPWYNHSVIVFELIGLLFILQYIYKPEHRYKFLYLAGAGLFIFISFFTKQDAGALAFCIAFVLVLYCAIVDKTLKPFLFFLLFFVGFGVIIVAPFMKYDFTYWFNLGQAPHSSRISIYDFMSIILGESRWEKLYFVIIAAIAVIKFKRDKNFFNDKRNFTFLLFTVGILVEATLFQVTSYVPPHNNIFFHAFCISYILCQLNIDALGKPAFLYPLVILLTLILWSESYWKYVDRIVLSKLFAQKTDVVAGNIGMHSYLLSTPCDTLRYSDPSTWQFAKYNSFKDILMPKQTVDGLDYIMNMDVVKDKDRAISILNMTELTPLAKEIGYRLPEHEPMWYHLGVGMFEKETNQFCHRIERKVYDVVLFEYIPGLNNFYPFAVRECLQQSYTLKKSFQAPRSDFQGFIEVYTRN